MLGNVDVILHRPQSSENIGAVARAMKNFGLSRLVMVAPRRYEASRAETLAVHAEEILHDAAVVPTLEDGIAPYTLVIPTTERAVPGRAAPLTPREAAILLLERSKNGRVALLFGEEAIGLSTPILARFHEYSSIPANPDRRSLNLAQAALLYSWELFQAAGATPQLARPDPVGVADEPSSLQVLSRVRADARRLLLGAGFLNPQAPDHALDELMRLLMRANPTRREAEMLLAAIAQLVRTSATTPPP